MKLLHIIATPRGEESSTLKVSSAFLRDLETKNPDLEIDELNLYKEQLPEMTVERVNGKYALLSGKDLSEEMKGPWSKIEKEIERFLSANIILFSVPMWNFSIPYKLKQYLDVIVQPKYLFHYTENGPEGLATDKKGIVITSRGGDYSGDLKTLDQQEPYLRQILGFIGISEPTFINAQPMNAGGEDAQKKGLKDAISKAREIVNSI